MEIVGMYESFNFENVKRTFEPKGRTLDNRDKEGSSVV